MFRSRAGQMVTGQANDDVDDDDDDDAAKINPANLLHNSHWIESPGLSGPSRYVGYYDAASLYPSSSKFFIFKLRH